MTSSESFIVLGDTGHHEFDDDVLNLVNQAGGHSLKFSHIWHSTWPDGELGMRLEEPERVAGKNVIIFSCPITAKLELQLRDMITSCKQQYRARSVTVVLPFLRYRRQDRQELDHEITRLRWFMRDHRHYGADNLIVCDPHSEEATHKYAQEFGLELWNADPTRLFADALRGTVQTLGGSARCRIYSPDFGSIPRALSLGAALGLEVIATPKKRMNGEVMLVENAAFLELARATFGENISLSCNRECASGMNIFMREDEVDSASTAVKTAHELRKAGVATMHFLATHPVCSRGWKQRMFPYKSQLPFDTVWLGNTRPRGDEETAYEGSTGDRVKRVAMQPVIAEKLLEVIRSLE